MAGFFKKLVGNMPFARGEPRQGVFLCAFGKHPGERDHFEYMPPDSKKLSDVWHFLYDNGMKVLVPQWKALLPAERLDAFNHVFVWRDGERVVAGRMWSSSDGASPPRKDFPMVVCAECRGLPLVWALSSALPQLARVETRSKETDSIAVVRAVLDGARDELRRIAASAPATDTDPASAPAAAPVRRVLAELAERPELGPDGEGLLRVLYFLSGELPVIEGKRGSNRGTPDRTLIMRVPWCAASAPDAARVWTELALNFAEPRTPLMCVVPLDQPWLDVIIGEPTEAQLTCIRSSLERIPLTTSVPYNMDDAFVQRCRQLIAEGRQAVADRRGAARGPDSDDMRTIVAPLKPRLAGDPARASGGGQPDTWVERVTVRNDNQPQRPPGRADPTPPPASAEPAPTAAPPRPELSKPEVKLPVAPETLRPVERQVRPPPLPADAQAPADEIRRPPVQPQEPAPVAPAADQPEPRKRGMSGPTIGMILLGGLALAAVVLGAGLKWGKFGKASGQPVGDSRPAGAPATAPAEPNLPTTHAAVPGNGAKGVEPVRSVQTLPISFPAGDPRADWPGLKSIAAARDAIASLEQEFAQKPDPAAGGELSRVEERWSRLRNRPLDEQRDLIAREVVEVAAMARKLEDHLKRALDEKRNQRQWLANLRSKKQPTASEPLNQHWRKHVLDTLPAESAPLTSAQFAAVKDRVAAWEQLLKRIDTELPAPRLQLKAPAPWPDSLGDEPALRRQQALATALAAVRVESGHPRLDDASLASAKQALEHWSSNAAAIIEDHARLETLLDSMSPLDDKSTGRSARETYSAWEGKTKAAPAKAADRIAALHARVKVLLDIEQSQDRAKLAALEGPAEARLAAWRRLGALPAAATDLARESALHEKVVSALDTLPDATRRAALAAEIRQAARTRWQTGMSAAADAGSVELLIQHMRAYGGEPSALDAKARFNVLLHDLKSRLASAAAEPDARQAIDNLAAAVKAGGLPPEAALLSKSLREVSDTGAGDESVPGPAVDPAWKKEPFDGGLRFTADSKDGAKHTLDFARVGGVEGAPAFYILTSEVSLGLLAHAVSSKGSWQTFSGLMGAGDDEPRGACGWRWADSSRTGLVLSQRWIDRRHTAFLEDPRHRAAAEEPYEAADLRDSVAAPGWQMPAQQLTAPAAAYVAALLKCRLPTSAEWKAAHAHQRQSDARPATPNLRDRSWARQHQYVSQRLKEGLNIDFPDRGIFRGRDRFAEGPDALVWEKGLNAAKAPAADAESLHPDGVLWFRAASVPEAERIRNLVGNVAEWVCDEPAVWKELATGKSWNKAGRLLSASKVAVIGGSALSPPEHAPDRPAPIRPEDVMRKYADVGFRLAFPAPSEPTLAKVKALVEAHPYLLK